MHEEPGVELVGLHINKKKLDQVKLKADRLGAGAGALELVNADMRDFSLDITFDLAIIPFRGFLALLTVEDQRRALLNIRKHLNIGGRLVFNIFVPDIQMLLQVGDTPYHLRDVTDPDTGAAYVLWQQSSYDLHDQIVDVRVSVEELDDQRAVVKKFYRDFQLRYAFRWEVYHLLVSCGFEVVDLYGDFDRTPFDETSGEMVWVARVP